MIAPIVAAVGASLGYRTAQNGGNLIGVIVNGAILGLLPVMLAIVGFGILLGGGIPAGTLGAFFGFSAVLWGTLVGGGFALSKAGRSLSMQARLTIVLLGQSSSYV